MQFGATPNASPKVSVLLPVYNAESYLRRAIESVLVQTFTDFELLALDDGSTDKSLSILREFAGKDSRVRVISRENRGLVVTLNELIAKSESQYLARMDADDICRPQRFERQVSYFDAHPDCVAVGTRSLIIDSDGMPITETTNELAHDEIELAHLSGAGESRMCHPSVMIRRDAIMQVGQYRREYQFAEDLDLFLRLGEIGKLANLPDVLLEYRQHMESIGYTHGDLQRNAARQALREAWLRRGIPVYPFISEPTTRPDTAADVHRMWAWWAMSAGNLATARKHAILALVRNPFNVESLRALACAIRGY
jgi:glycosyltransferase involved in cell wall biosynthesis